jgi:hypothetical protein
MGQEAGLGVFDRVWRSHTVEDATVRLLKAGGSKGVARFEQSKQ